MNRVAWLALLAVSGLAAQEGQSWGTVQAVVAKFENGQFSKHQFSGGLAIGSWVSPRWGVEAKGIYLPLERGAMKGKEGHMLGSVLFNLYPNSKQWIPYLALGAGATISSNGFAKTGEESNVNLHGGLGTLFKFKGRYVLQADVKAVRIVSNTQRWEYLGMFGFGCTWGGAKPAPAPAPAPAPDPKPVPKEMPAPEVPVQAPPPPPPPPPAPAPEPPPAVVAPPPPPPAPEPPKKIVLDEAVLHFPNGKNDLSADGIAAVKKVAESLKAFKAEYTLVVAGHTSSLGKPAFNKALSKRRADAVAAILIKAGIPAAAVKTVGIGPDKPIADNKTKDGQAKNRRVEIDIQTKAKVETRKVETTVQP